MKVIFLQTVGKSYPWEIKSVKPGYFRNFLLPKKFAVPVSEKIIKETEQMRKEQEILRLERVEKAKSYKNIIEWKALEFKVKSDWWHMYASINEKDISDRILSEFNITLEPKSIKHLKLKDVWESDINVNLWDWVFASVKVIILSDKKSDEKWKKWKSKTKNKNTEVTDVADSVNELVDLEKDSHDVLEKKVKKTKKSE